MFSAFCGSEAYLAGGQAQDDGEHATHDLVEALRLGVEILLPHTLGSLRVRPCSRCATIHSGSRVNGRVDA